MAEKKKIRVLEGIYSSTADDGDSIFLNLVKHLNKDEFEPVVLSFSDGMMVNEMKNSGIKVYEINPGKSLDKKNADQIRRVIIEEKIDLVHAHGSTAAENTFHAAETNKLPFVYTSHGWPFQHEKNFFRRKIKKHREEHIVQNAAINICTSQSEAGAGKKLFKNFNPEIIPVAVDTGRFNFNKSGEKIRKELGLSPDEIMVGFIAGFTHQNQPLTLIRAFEKVVASYPEIKLLMAGDGEEKEEAVKLIKEKGLGERIIMLPFRRDVPELLAVSDIFVLPTLGEKLPIVLLEAMAMKKAIITTDIDSATEIIRPGITGMLIGTVSLEKNIADAITLLVKNKSLREALAEGALFSISNQRDVVSMTKEYEKIYRRLVLKELE